MKSSDAQTAFIQRGRPDNDLSPIFRASFNGFCGKNSCGFKHAFVFWSPKVFQAIKSFVHVESISWWYWPPPVGNLFYHHTNGRLLLLYMWQAPVSWPSKKWEQIKNGMPYVISDHCACHMKSCEQSDMSPLWHGTCRLPVYRGQSSRWYLRGRWARNRLNTGIAVCLNTSLCGRGGGGACRVTIVLLWLAISERG